MENKMKEDRLDNALAEKRRLFAELCKRAMNDELSVREFLDLPIRHDPDAFLKQVAADLEDAVEHTPGKPFTFELDREKWHKDPAYLTLYLDCSLLQSRASSEILMHERKEILRRKPVTREGIEQDLSARNLPPCAI